MKLLTAFLSIVEDWRGVFPQQRTYQRAVRQAWVRWFAWAGVVYRGLSGPTEASNVAGARSIFSTHAASGNPSNYSSPSSSALWLIVHNA